MKKRRKRILPLILCVGCLLAVSVPAMADDWIDLDKTGSIGIDIRAYATDDAVGGGSLDLYRIADTVLTSEGVAYAYTASFSGCGEDLLTEDALSKAETAETFYEWVDAHSVAAAQTVTVSSTGSAQFTDLSLGLYLVTQNRAAEGYNPINAFVVSVPLHEDGTWVYDVDATPKTSPVTQIETPPTSEPTPVSGPTGDGRHHVSVTHTAKTGDTHNLYVYGVLIIAAVLAIVVVLRRRLRRAAE